VGKPDVDKIEGLTPAIAIDQKTTSKNPRSTVGTITEIYDYFRLLYARVGVQHCHKCGKEISQMSASDIIAEVAKLPEGAKLVMLAPLVRDNKGSYADLIQSLVPYGELEIDILNHEELDCKAHMHYSEHNACFDCKISFDPLEPLSFSFNSPKGACSECDGLGLRYALDLEKIIDPDSSIEKGAIKIVYGFNKGYYFTFLKGFCEANGIDITVPYSELERHQQKAILHGSIGEVEFLWKKHKVKRIWPGIVRIAYDMFKDEKELNDYMSEKVCDVCGGHRLKPESLAVKVADKKIPELLDMPISKTYEWFAEEKNFEYMDKQNTMVAAPILNEIRERLFFLHDVGLGYITLGRDARTISGGEAQRIRIASQIGSGLTGVMYVLDEPSIGLHERDTLKLIKTLRNLQEKGNSVIVVEHDKETIENADFIVDIGEGAGKFGGSVVFAGTLKELKKAKTSTADYLFGRKKIEYFYRRKQEKFVEIKNVNLNNIQDLSVKIPLNNFVCITGVSGSGKSSLILQTLLPTARELLNHARKVNKVAGVEINGLENVDKVIYLDQSPIGRTPRSNPATYTGVMDEIRNLFAQTKESQIRGYTASRFSFNVKGGRCEKCQGEGEIKIEMHFLPDIMVKCDSCKGQRYNQQTLEVLYKGQSISDVLKMSVDEAFEFFKPIPKIHQKLKTLVDVGLGYITLGQNAVTLSGGEAQRIKLSKELSRKDTGKTLYILDEPTTGLHFADVDRLTGVLHKFVELGNSVLVIEHNLDMIKNADYIVDIGPEGGSGGGEIVDVGSPEELAANYEKSGSYTGKYLEKELLLHK
ncbi:MAG: excinuclease ABC subunit UvrA, partial [Sulfurimonas sp.]